MRKQHTKSTLPLKAETLTLDLIIGMGEPISPLFEELKVLNRRDVNGNSIPHTAAVQGQYILLHHLIKHDRRSLFLTNKARKTVLDTVIKSAFKQKDTYILDAILLVDPHFETRGAPEGVIIPAGYAEARKRVMVAAKKIYQINAKDYKMQIKRQKKHSSPFRPDLDFLLLNS